MKAKKKSGIIKPVKLGPYMHLAKHFKKTFFANLICFLK